MYHLPTLPYLVRLAQAHLRPPLQGHFGHGMRLMSLFPDSRIPLALFFAWARLGLFGGTRRPALPFALAAPSLISGHRNPPPPPAPRQQLAHWELPPYAATLRLAIAPPTRLLRLDPALGGVHWPPYPLVHTLPGCLVVSPCVTRLPHARALAALQRSSQRPRSSRFHNALARSLRAPAPLLAPSVRYAAPPALCASRPLAGRLLYYCAACCPFVLATLRRTPIPHCNSTLRRSLAPPFVYTYRTLVALRPDGLPPHPMVRPTSHLSVCCLFRITGLPASMPSTRSS
ncbi:hypothetical protein B0H11DRAFT_2292770 [Mycena galericulata]|nr:hypothetical protein B0H11DRAFT_2292770 [Mycena galericulata]